MVQDIGEIVIKKEHGQSCKKCETLVYCKPNFDQDATDKAMDVVIKKIKRTMYGIEDLNKPAWVPRHSEVQDREKPHDSLRLVFTILDTIQCRR